MAAKVKIVEELTVASNVDTAADLKRLALREPPNRIGCCVVTSFVFLYLLSAKTHWALIFC